MMTTDWYALPAEERYESLISILNHDIRNVTLVHVLDGNLKTANDLRTGFARVVDTEARNLNIPLKGSFSGYCHDTFVPIGMVAEEKHRRRGHRIATGWRLAEAGEEIGRPAAAHAIKTACAFGLSTYEVFGSTNSAGECRGPYNTVRIMEELENGPKKERDLSNVLNVNHNVVYKHLKRLEKVGFVDYDSWSSEKKGQFKYRWIAGKPDDVETVDERRTLTRNVAELLYMGGDWDRNAVAEALRYQSPQPISTVLSGLEKSGFVERTTLFKAGEMHSEAKLREHGQKFLRSFINPVRTSAMDREPAAELARSLGAHEDWSVAYAENTFASVLYSRASPYFTMTPGNERMNEILELLREGKMRPVDIERRMGIHCKGFLKELVQEGRVRKDREGNAVWYELVV